ncbi:TPA: hypothetical protein EYQ19_01565 [Candidatus Pacearchaeota archaeon]|nr:hypothetical protein [Candidatus Pacearchaeota archaeon]
MIGVFLEENKWEKLLKRWKIYCKDIKLRILQVENYNYLKEIGLPDGKIASQAQLLGLNPDTIRGNYDKLKEIGLKDSKIATNAALLSRGPDTIRRHYENLKEIGLKDSKIATLAHLLGSNPDTIRWNYDKLKEIGLKDSKIATQAQLLGGDPETIRGNYDKLKEMGLKDSKIASRAELLSRDPETIRWNYQNHVGLLRTDYQDRDSGKEILLQQASLLGISSNTLESNVQWFADRNIDYGVGMTLGTKTQTKRKKLAWILREVFDYREISKDQKSNTIKNMYDFVRTNPGLLFDSIKTLEKKKDKLREKVIPNI